MRSIIYFLIISLLTVPASYANWGFSNWGFQKYGAEQFGGGPWGSSTDQDFWEYIKVEDDNGNFNRVPITTVLSAGRLDYLSNTYDENVPVTSDAGLLNYGSYINLILQSEDLSTSNWEKIANVAATVDEVTFTENNSRLKQIIMSQGFTSDYFGAVLPITDLTVDWKSYELKNTQEGKNYTCSMEIKAGSTTRCELRLWSRAAGSLELYIADNDEFNNDTIFVRNVQISETPVAMPYAMTTTATVTVPQNNADVDEGNKAEIAGDLLNITDGKSDEITLDSGNLVALTRYLVITTETDHFGAGVVAGDRITGLTTALDTNNTVQTLLSAQGSVTFDWEPEFSSTDVLVTGNILTVNDSASEMLKYTSTGFELTDGTNTASVTYAYLTGVEYQIEGNWGTHPIDGAEKLWLVIKDSGGNVIAQSDIEDFAGTFSPGSELSQAWEADLPQNLKNITWYQDVQDHTPTPYYVSNAGNDSNDGLTESTTWLTVGKVVSGALQPGDAVYFNKGETHADARLRLQYSGSVENRITYSAYGTGNDPILRSVYQRESINGPLSNVTIENLHLQGDVSDALSVRGVDFSGTYTNVTVQNCEMDNYVNEGFYYFGTGAHEYVNLLIDTNNIHGNALSGIFLKVENSDTSDVTIRNNTVTGNILDVSEGQPATNYDNVTVSGGIALLEENYVDSTGADTATGFFGSGVDLDTRVATVRYNTMIGVDLGDAAFSMKSFTGDLYYAYGNTITNGGGSGVQMTSRDTNGGVIHLYNNIFAYNIGVGITRTVVADLYMSNNMFYQNGSSDPLHTWHTSQVFCFDNGTINGDPRNGIIADNNLYYTTESVPMNRNRRTVATTYDTSFNFSEWQSIPHDANGTDSAPLFVSPGSGNFRLDVGSPALTTGATLGAPYNYGIDDSSTIEAENIDITLILRNPYDMGAFQQ